MSKFKVAIIEPVGGHGGMDYTDFGLCGGLVSAGVTPVLYTCDETSIKQDTGFEVNTWFRGIYGKSPAWRRGLRFVAGMMKVYADIILRRIPIVHYHFFHVGLLQVFMILAALISRRRVVITVHDVEAFVEGQQQTVLARSVYSAAHRLIVHNMVSRRELVGQMRIQEEKISVIPLGNYLHCFPQVPSQAEAKRHLEFSGETFILLFFGQIKKVKGLDILLEALPAVIARHPNVHLLIAGREVDVPFSEYQEIIDRNALAGHCSCHIRFIRNEDVPFYYRAADMVVLPYRRIYQSGVVLMAMGLGVPVIVSDIPGMLEVIEDSETGFVFRDGDAGDLASRLNTIIPDNALQGRVAGNARSLVERRYAWEEIGRHTASLYSNLIGVSGKGGPG